MMTLTLLFLAAFQIPLETCFKQELSQEKIFSLIDRFDAVDTSALPFIKIWTGEATFRNPTEGRLAVIRYGFLLGEGKGRFTVRYLDLTQETLRSPSATTKHSQRYDQTDLATYARSFTKRLNASKSGGSELRKYLGPHALMSPQAEAILLARSCLRRDLKDEVASLWKQAGSIQAAVKDLGVGLQWKLILDFANRELTHTQLLDRHRVWLRSFPKHPMREAVMNRAGILESMIQDAKKRLLDKRDEGKPTLPERVADLIYSLRFQRRAVTRNGMLRYMVPWSKERTRNKFSDLLYALKYSSVPALIQALDDESFTRCVYYSSRHGGSFHIASVAQHAEEVLKRIAGRSMKGTRAERKAGWKAWMKAGYSTGN